MDITWLLFAFVLGFLAFRVGFPPLVGYLLAGFGLNYFDVVGGEVLQEIADIGILLLLFTIGLKLSVKSLFRPYIYGSAVLHIILISVFFWGVILVVNWVFDIFLGLQPEQALLAAFALSFSSTVFAVKVLEEKGEMGALHGKVAIGVLVMQDVFAVIFLTVSTGKMPELWAIGLLIGLWPARYLLAKLIQMVGHGEILLLLGIVLALGGAELFALAGLKPDLGALLLGVILSGVDKSKELSRQLLELKDLFLVGFFLSIGLGAEIELWHLAVVFVLISLMLVKSSLYFFIFVRFKLRARTSFLSTLALSNYSEFGLIVAALGVKQGMLPDSMLVIIAITVAVSFIISAPLNVAAQQLYGKFSVALRRLESNRRLDIDEPIDIKDSNVLIFGMGRVGMGAYDELAKDARCRVLGVDSNPEKIVGHKQRGRDVIIGDATDFDFWSKLSLSHVSVIMLSMPNYIENKITLERIKSKNFQGKVAVIAKYSDHTEQLNESGADAAYNIYAEAGSGFANHVSELLDQVSSNKS